MANRFASRASRASRASWASWASALIVAGIFAWAAACGSSDASGLFSGGDGSAGSVGDASPGSSDASPGDDAASAGDDAGGGLGGDASPTEVCATKATQKACVQCCGQAYPQGASVAVAAELQCGCQLSRCRVQCLDTACAQPPKDPSNECASCLRATLRTDAGAKDCLGPTSQACQQSADCIAYAACSSTACQGKP